MYVTIRPVDAERKMIKQLLYLQSGGKFCDLAIKTGCDVVHAHKCILASSLEYFRTSFSFSESTRAELETSIDLSHLHCDCKTLRKVITSLYSNEIDITERDVAGILQLADYFMHNDLLIAIEKYMEDTLEISKAALYFQLCLQYGFDKNPLFARVCVLLSSRMHDYLIHQTSSLDWSLDVVEVMMRYNLFDYCSPLQMTTFILKKLKMLFSQSHLYGKDELNETALAVLNILDLFFAHIDKSTLFKWGSKIIDFFNTWMESVNDKISSMNDVWTKLIVIRNLAKSDCKDVTKILDSITNQIGHREIPPVSVQGGDIDITASIVPVSPFPSEVLPKETTSDSSTPLSVSGSESNTSNHLFVKRSSLKGDSVICISPYNRADDKKFQNTEGISGSSTNSSNNMPSSTQSTDDKNDSPSFNQSHNSIYIPPSPEDDSERLLQSQNEFDLSETCNGLVVLSPCYEMVSQLMEVEDRTAKPLLRSPKLSLHFYDTDLRMWRFGGDLKFPLQGHMMEKHAWRMAFVRKSLFLFSLTKRKGLEYNTESGEWTELFCEIIFQPHYSFNDDGTAEDDMNSFHVRSIIPISMEDSLVVLAMSREPQADRSFWTQQHIYQFDFETRTFQHITFVRDARMALPMTKYTVDGNQLVTVKASTMMFGDLQMFNVQHVHIYNSKTKALESHEVECAMKSGLKIFLQEKKLYLLNNFCEYRVYCLVTRELTDWIRLGHFSPYLNCGDPDLEISYPAGIRASCHAGSSRWILDSNFNVESASLSELYVSKDADFVQRCHPNPPFLYMMTMCSARLNKSQMTSLGQAMFHVRAVNPNKLPMTTESRYQ